MAKKATKVAKIAGEKGKADKALIKCVLDSECMDYEGAIAAAKREGARAAYRAVDKTLTPNRKSKFVTAQIAKLD